MDETLDNAQAQPQGDAFDQFLAQNATPSPEPSSSGQQGGASPITAYSRPPGARGGGAIPSNDEGGFASFIRGAADSVGFGFADEVGGVLDTLGAPDGAGTQHETVFNSDKSFSAILAGNIAKERGLLANDRENHTVASVAGGLAGGLLLPFGLEARGALQVAKVGAAQGAAYGLGSGEGVVDRVEEAAKGGAIGGVVGAVLGRFLPGLKNSATRGAGDDATVAAEQAFDKTVAEQPTVAGPDGTTYATHLEDGSTLKGFHQDGSPAYARAEAAPVEALPEAAPSEVTLEAAPATPDAAPTPIGTIGRTELQSLQDDVANFRESMAYGGDRQADITRAGTPEAAARVGEFRLGNLGEDLDTANLLSALSRQLPASGRKTDLELAQTAGAVANAVGEDSEAMLAWAKQAAGTLGDVDNTMMALRSVWSRASADVNAYHLAGVDWAQADDSMVVKAGLAIRNLSELSKQVQIAKVGLGRGLRVNSLPDAETYLKTLLAKGEEGAEGVPATATDRAPQNADAAKGVSPVGVREAPPLPRNRKELQDWFDLWGMQQGNPKGQSDFLQGLLTVPTPGKYLRTSVANFFTASILSAPRTIAMNVIGPSLIALVRNAERMGGAAAGALNPFASAEERAAMRAVMRETPSAYLRGFGEIADAMRFGLQAAEKNQSVLGGGSSTTDALASYGPLTTNLLGAAGADPDWRYGLGNLINVFPKAFARLNNGLDETAKRMSYLGEVRVRAQVDAAQKGLAGDAFQQHVRDALKGSFDEVGHAADERLLRAAERTTFTSQVGEEGTQLRKFSSWMQGLRRDIPETRYIVPVFNVPANALGETLRRIPLANRFLSSHAADLAGENGVVAQAEAHGRTLMGASFLMAGVMMNRMGILTGAGPQEATDRKVWLQTHQPYSILVGDKWVRYDKFDILGGLLSIPSTISDASTYRAADQGVGDMMLAGAGAMAQWFKDRASLRTATALLNAGSDPTSDFGTILNQFASSTAAGFIPAAFRTTTVDTTDPYIRMRRDWQDYLKASIPGLSQTLEPTRNVLGEPIQRSADTFGEALFPVTMQSATSYKEDPVMDELARIYETTGYGAGADPKSLGFGYFNPKDVKLEDGRSIYDRAMQKRMTMQIDGKDLRQTLKDLFDSQDYNDAVDADSTQRVTSLGDASRGYMVRKVFDQFNKAAKSELASESPKADAYLTAAAAKQRDDAYLRDVSVEDLVATPRLYQDKGINAAAYSEKIRGGASSDPLAQALGL